MSTFAVEVVRLGAILPHPNADKIELAEIGGYHAVVQKGIHASGGIAVYVPEDAVLPFELIEAWGFTGKLAGKAKNRVKAIRLRGELSQGLVIPLATVLDTLSTKQTAVTIARQIEDEESHGVVEMHFDFVGWDKDATASFLNKGFGDDLEGFDLTLALGIEKYEPTIPAHMSGIAMPRPSWLPKYTEIENIKRRNRVLEDGEPVIFTEKIHGTNVAIGMLAADGEMFVSSRQLVLQRDEHNLYWKTALKFELESHLKSILAAMNAESVVIYGEIYGRGVQDLTYGVASGDYQFRCFDILVDGNYVDFETFVQLVGAEANWEGRDDDGNDFYRYTSDLPMVPILYNGPWNPDVAEFYTHGLDTISGTHIREGIVIRPLFERNVRSCGRVIFKALSDEYLLRENGTEHV
jgi:RNA ligase (TIGR02306 family)